MHHLTGQQFRETFLSRVDARVLLLSALALLALLLTGRGFAFPLGVTALCLGACIRMGVTPAKLALRFAEPAFIAGMIVILKLFSAGHDPLFSVTMAGFGITGYREGLMDGLLIAARVMGAVSVVTTLGYAAPFTDLMAALAWLRVPKGFIEVTFFAWRYLFLLLEDARTIHGAQKNRLGYAGCRQGLRSFGTLTGALVIKAFDNSRNITTAMVQRGYDGNMPMLRHRSLRASEVAVSLAFIVCMGLLWQI